MSKDAVVQLLGRTRPKIQAAVAARAARRPASSDLRALRVAAERPTVLPIYWDRHFLRTPTDVSAFNEFLRALFESSWMTGLGVHGVSPPRLLPALLPSDPAPLKLRQPELEARLRAWISRDGSRGARAGFAPITYFVMTPSRTELVFDRRSSGWLNPSMSYVAVPLRSTTGDVLDAHALTISRELARTLITARKRSLD